MQLTVGVHASPYFCVWEKILLSQSLIHLLRCLLASSKLVLDPHSVSSLHTFCWAQFTRSFRPSNTTPSFSIASIEVAASPLIAKETYPTPFDTPFSRTTNAERTGAKSEKRVCISVEVAVYGRLETNSVPPL